MLRGLVPLAAKLRITCEDGLRRRFASANAASKKLAAKRKATVPAEPATVKPYERHVFVQLPRPAEALEGGPWWPSVVESNPALLGMFSRVAALQTEHTGANQCQRQRHAPSHPADAASTPLQCRRSRQDHSHGGSQATSQAQLASRRRCVCVGVSGRCEGNCAAVCTIWQQ